MTLDVPGTDLLTEGPDESTLEVSFMDTSWLLVPGESLTFGRSADLVIDDANPFMHRHVGRFVWSDGLWWLENTGRSIRLAVLSEQGAGFEVPPASPRAPMWLGDCRIRFGAGRASYELVCRTSSLPLVGPSPWSPPEEPPTDVISLNINEDQRRLITALAERHLIDPSLRHVVGWELPSNQQVALRLGWTITAYNRKLDRLCDKAVRHGVLKPGSPDRWRDRRQHLVKYALESGLVTSSDRFLLDDDDPPQPE